MLRKVLVICAVLAALLALAGTALAADDADKGKTLWTSKNCKSCHGANGEGKYAAALAGSKAAAADWVKQVRTPAAKMPAYSTTQVADQDLADMLAYMKTLTAPASFTPVVYTPAAGDPPGKVLYNQKECVACHGGADPTNFLKTRFTDKARTLAAADVIKQLRTPAANMPMFSATQVSDAEAGQIADWFNALLKAAPATAAPAPAALPKSGDRLPLELIVLAGFCLVAIGGGLRYASRRSG